MGNQDCGPAPDFLPVWTKHGGHSSRPCDGGGLPVPLPTPLITLGDPIRSLLRLCPSYPQKLLVPVWITDKELENVASFRSWKRIPVVVYR